MLLITMDIKPLHIYTQNLHANNIVGYSFDLLNLILGDSKQLMDHVYNYKIFSVSSEWYRRPDTGPTPAGSHSSWF